MSKNSHDKRPLSPHLQVYRLPYNALMSISGRAVGVVLALSLVILCMLFIAVVWQPGLFDVVMGMLDYQVFSYIFLLWAFGVFFYIGNGIRHYLWDKLIGLNERQGILSGNIVLFISFLLTAGLWSLTCGCGATN